MATMFVAGLPIPKARPRLGRGRVYTPARTRDYQRAIWASALAAGLRASREPISVSLVFHLPSPGRCDLDNLIKAVLDGLKGAAYHDDRQVVRLTAEKRRADRAHPPGVHVQIGGVA